MIGPARKPTRRALPLFNGVGLLASAFASLLRAARSGPLNWKRPLHDARLRLERACQSPNRATGLEKGLHA